MSAEKKKQMLIYLNTTVHYKNPTIWMNMGTAKLDKIVGKIAKGFLKSQGEGTASPEEIAKVAEEFIQILRARSEEFKTAMLEVNGHLEEALAILERGHRAAIGNAPVHEPKGEAYRQPQPEPEPEPKGEAYRQPQPEPEPEPEHEPEPKRKVYPQPQPERSKEAERERRDEELSRMTRVAEEKLPMDDNVRKFMELTGMNLTYATRSLNNARGDLRIALNRQFEKAGLSKKRKKSKRKKHSKKKKTKKYKKKVKKKYKSKRR